MIRCLCARCHGHVVFHSVAAYLLHAGNQHRAFVITQPKTAAS